MNDARDRVNDYLGHIIAAIDKIRRYTTRMDRGQFLADERTQDAVVKNLENIGFDFNFERDPASALG